MILGLCGIEIIGMQTIGTNLEERAESKVKFLMVRLCEETTAGRLTKQSNSNDESNSVRIEYYWKGLPS